MVFAIYCLFEAAVGLVKALIWICSLPVRALLAVSNACSTHNRRRATRKAFQRDQLARAQYYAGRAPQSQQWPPPIPVQPWRYGAPSTHRRGLPGGR